MQEDQRLTLVNKGGTSFLVPAEGREGQINSYAKWNQAFRVFSEIITASYPAKAKELIQYNHVIHTASQTYIWENIYAYDNDFHLHISKKTQRTWSVILQQAWSMCLKDRVKDFSFNQGKGSSSGSSKNDYCRRFQEGKCHDGLACKYEHRCAICNKFGHGAHICRKRSFYRQNDYDNDRYGDRYHYYSDRCDSSTY